MARYAEHIKNPVIPRDDTSSAPVTFSLGVWRVKVSMFVQAERREIMQLMRGRIEQPLAAFERSLENVKSPDVRAALIQAHLEDVYQADRLWPPPWQSREFWAEVYKVENIPDVMEIILKHHNPDLAPVIHSFLKSFFETGQGGDASLGDEIQSIVNYFLAGPAEATVGGILDVPKDGGPEGPDGPEATRKIGPSSSDSSANTTDSAPIPTTG